MTVPPQVSGDALFVFGLLAIDKVCRQFEAELKAGKEPRIEAFLGDTPEPQRRELRHELEAVQRERGHGAGHHAMLAQFVQNLVASGVLTEEQVQTVLDQLGTDQRPESADDLAKVLHRQGHLTRFQAKAVYQGKTRGLVLGNYVVLEKPPFWHSTTGHLAGASERADTAESPRLCRESTEHAGLVDRHARTQMTSG